MDANIRTDVERYVASTLRLLRGVPEQRPDPVAQREASENIRVIQSRMPHFPAATRAELEPPLTAAFEAVEEGQLGLALACLERVEELLRQTV